MVQNLCIPQKNCAFHKCDKKGRQYKDLRQCVNNKTRAFHKSAISATSKTFTVCKKPRQGNIKKKNTTIKKCDAIPTSQPTTIKK